jgi:hypothetical protein
METQKPIHTDRETARVKLMAKIADTKRGIENKSFSTYPLDALLADAEFRLRYLDCAPEGANHLLAPLQDKRGVPMGNAWNENIGPGVHLRNARVARGLNPFSGLPDDDYYDLAAEMGMVPGLDY